MPKKRVAALGIILFAASLFPWSVLAQEVSPNTPVRKCIKVTDQSKEDQAGPAAEKKPKKRKG